ncbi:hypothetical protein ACVWW1_007142 [Bradyrhizobium sp. JR3.5]
MPPERFPARWIPVRVKKTRQKENREPRSDSIGTEMALVPNQRPLGQRLLWFAALWLGGVGTVTLVSFALRLWIAPK